MKILVMAAGAVGGYFGALLSKHNDVILISRGENLKTIKKMVLRYKVISQVISLEK